MTSAQAIASQFDLVAPAGSVKFGAQIAQLPNGNIVVTDPERVGGGAVYLFGPSGNLISTLTGETNAERSTMKIQVLANGNYVVINPNWSDGTTSLLGAVTFGNAVTGVSGVVSSANSLIGATYSDMVGKGGVTPLSNGNYVVGSQFFTANGVQRAGAITWGDGSAGTHGVVSQDNSIIGTKILESIGLHSVRALPNGNYLVVDVQWGTNTRGTVMWVDGSKPSSQPLGSGASLVGSHDGDGVGDGGVIILSNGNYVVISPDWNQARGAATWVDGATGLAAEVSEANSLVGSLPGQAVGFPSVTALVDGNAVVCSSNWGSAEIPYAGAITWIDGRHGFAGQVAPQNSLIGAHAYDFLGTSTGINGSDPAITPLPDGGYVVKCPFCDNGTVIDAGVVSAAEGGQPINGYYDPANALVGSEENDNVGFGPTSALTNGNFVIASQKWQSSPGVIAGAVTLVDRHLNGRRVVSTANSLYGTPMQGNPGAHIADHIFPLTNGNFVVDSYQWQKDGMQTTGASTWGDGRTGVIGLISAQNSLIGSHEGDAVGGVIPFPSGNYVVFSPHWTNDSKSAVGAVTWADGSHPTVGPVTESNSLTGARTMDQVGDGTLMSYGDNRVVVLSNSFDDGDVVNAGAVTVLDDRPTSGGISLNNSVIGTFPWAGTGNWGGIGLEFVYDPSRSRLVVGRYATNTVTIFTPDASTNLFSDGFEDDARCEDSSGQCQSQ